jgi:probable HAF family extracellular repeat protein
MRLKLLPYVLALALCTTSVLAAPQVRYRITPITAPPGSQLTATGLNNRGEVVGSWSGEVGQHGFYWRDGRLVDLNDQVYPNAGYVEASGINDRSQIVGIYSDAVVEGFHAFVLERGRMRDVEGPPGAQHVFASFINDRGQILGASYDQDGNYSSFLNDHGTVEVFDPFFDPADINASGTVSGSYYLDGSRAAIWKDGVITPIGPLFSQGRRLNDRGQVTGAMNNNIAARAFVWERGRLTQLPALRADQTYSWALDINNAGRIVGTTVINGPTGTVSIATVWDNGQVADLNALIHPHDPLRAFVTFTSAGPINDRGEIVAQGMDSRIGSLDIFFLEPVQH